MTVKDLYELFIEFKTNDFCHLVKKVDALLFGVITLLGAVIASIVILLLK